MSQYYKEKKVFVSGQHGFIGAALTKNLKDEGAIISGVLEDGVEIIFNFAGPTHMKFECSVDYYTQSLIQQHLYFLNFAQKNNAQYVWASSALVYEEEKITPFRHFKMALEELQKTYDCNALGLRIFPVYGPGEKNKQQQYRTAIYQWCEIMSQGKSPIVFGDGNQTRDFIFIDDLIKEILRVTIEKSQTNEIIDMGHGREISFNSIIKDINRALGTDIKPNYVTAPVNYSSGIFSKNPVPLSTPVRIGVKRILENL